MADTQIEEVKGKVDIVDLISEYVELKKAGRNFKGLCPFHSEKSPSFMVTPEMQIFKCFGCGAGGDVFRFIMEYEKMEFGEALKFLADRVGVKLQPMRGAFVASQKDELYQTNSTIASFYHYVLKNHLLGKEALKYLEKRGVSEESIDTFKLGFSPESSVVTVNFLTKKRNLATELLMRTGVVGQSGSSFYDRFRGRVMFPLLDHLGNTAGFAGRIIDSNAKTAKYINTPETPVYKKGNLLYAINLTKQEIKKKGFAVVVEGELDCIASYQAGVENVVAIKGSALTEAQLRLLSRFCSRIVLALDSDFAGDEAARRGIKIAANLGLTLKVARIAPYKDPDEAVRADPDFWKKAIEGAQDVYEFLIDSVFNKYDKETTEGKSKISREVSPVLAEVEDDILKAHLVKLVAERLKVGQQAVILQASKFVDRVNKFEQDNNLIIVEEKPKLDARRELLEKHLLTCVLQHDPAMLGIKKTDELIATTLARKLFEFLKEHYSRYEKLNLTKVAEELPAELQEYLALVVLVQSEDEDARLLKRRVDEAFRNLEIHVLKEEIAEIIMMIKEAENKDNEENLEMYERDLGKLTQKLAELELS